MTNKYFIVSDVHSYYKELKQALKEAGFDIKNEHHIFVSLGDLLDRGPDSDKCLNFVNRLPKRRKILIRGNHETLLQELLLRQYPLEHDYHNGTYKTVLELCKAYMTEEQKNNLYNVTDIYDFVRNNKQLNKYLKQLTWYRVINKNIFVHGWLPCEKIRKMSDTEYKLIEDFQNATDEQWDNATWINGMDFWNNGLRPKDYTIFCGHYHTLWGHRYIEHQIENNFDPFVHKGIVALDACTVVSKKVNCYVIEEEVDE